MFRFPLHSTLILNNWLRKTSSYSIACHDSVIRVGNSSRGLWVINTTRRIQTILWAVSIHIIITNLTCKWNRYDSGPNNTGNHKHNLLPSTGKHMSSFASLPPLWITFYWDKHSNHATIHPYADKQHLHSSQYFPRTHFQRLYRIRMYGIASYTSCCNSLYPLSTENQYNHL